MVEIQPLLLDVKWLNSLAAAQPDQSSSEDEDGTCSLPQNRLSPESSRPSRMPSSTAAASTQLQPAQQHQHQQQGNQSGESYCSSANSSCLPSDVCSIHEVTSLQAGVCSLLLHLKVGTAGMLGSSASCWPLGGCCRHVIVYLASCYTSSWVGAAAMQSKLSLSTAQPCCLAASLFWEVAQPALLCPSGGLICSEHPRVFCAALVAVTVMSAHCYH